MLSQTYLPSSKFGRLISRYIIVTDHQNRSEWQDVGVMPNGVSGLGFSFREDFRYVVKDGNGRKITCGNMIGIHNRPYVCQWKDPVGMFVILFKPLGLFRLLNADMGELKNDMTPLSLLGIREAEWITENLSRTEPPGDKIRFMETWLEQRLASSDLSYSVTDLVVDEIIRRNGMVTVSRLAKELNINKKYIERNFQLRLGLSPKVFAEITRFRYISSQLLQHADISWQELAYHGNFHDQSHLIKHFQKLTGTSPDQFREMINASTDTRFTSLLNVVQLVTGPANEMD